MQSPTPLHDAKTQYPRKYSTQLLLLLMMMLLTTRERGFASKIARAPPAVATN